jgi:hypothetical protein
MFVSPELPRAFWPKEMLARENKRPPLIETGEYVTAIEPGVIDAPVMAPVRKGPIPAPVEGRYTPGPGHSIIRGGFTWRNAQVLPGSYWNLDGSLNKYVQGGLLIQTQAEVNVKVPWPEAKTNTDPNPVITGENDRLNAEVENLAAGNKMLVAQLNELREQMRGRERMISELTDRAAHWEREANKLQELIQVMEGGDPGTKPGAEVASGAGAEDFLSPHGPPPRPGLVYEEASGSWIDPVITAPVRVPGSTPAQNPTIETVEK